MIMMMCRDCAKAGKETRATTLTCFPSGERAPLCDDHARYWLGLRPYETWLEPLESYADPLETAGAVLRQATRPEQPPLSLVSAQAPQSSASAPGMREPAARNTMRQKVTDVPPGPPPQPEPTAMRQAASSPQDRMLTAEEKSYCQAYGVTEAQYRRAVKRPPPARGPASAPAGQPERATHGLQWWLGSTIASIIAGIVLLVAGHQGSYTADASDTATAWGITFLVVFPVLLTAIAAITAIAKDTAGRHRQWISQFPPEQQERIRKAERAAAWGALAVGEAAFHEHVRHSREQQAAQYQAREAASRAQREATEAQQRHQELLAALGQQNQPAGPQLYGGRSAIHGNMWRHDLQGNWHQV